MIEPQGKSIINENTIEYRQIKSLLEDDYQLGTLNRVYEIFGGYVNRSFGAEMTNPQGEPVDYFIRRYREESLDADIQFEHDIVTYVIEKGFDLAADVIRMPDGKSFIKKPWEEEGETKSYPWAVYRYLYGGDPYDWLNNNLTAEEYGNMGSCLARFHSCGYGFNGGVKAEARIYDLLANKIKDYPRLTDGVDLPSTHRFIQSFNGTLPYILDLCKKIRNGMEESGMLEKAPKVFCHSDFHVSNVKWIDHKICGVFDFDWTKEDYRFVDICYSMFISMGNWETFREGTLDEEYVEAYLKGYNDTTKELGILPPFTDEEKEAFPYMFLAGGMYLYNWCTDFFYDWKNNNEYEWCYYLDHIVRTLRFVETHADEFKEIILAID